MALLTRLREPEFSADEKNVHSIRVENGTGTPDAACVEAPHAVEDQAKMAMVSSGLQDDPYHADKPSACTWS